MSGGVDDIDVDIDDHRDHRNNNNMNDSTTTIEIKHGKLQSTSKFPSGVPFVS